MALDIALAVCNFLLVAALGLMGVYVTLHPPRSVKVKKRWKWGFIAAAALACILIGWQTYRNDAEQASLHAQLDKIQKNTETPPQVTVNVPPSPPPQIIFQEGKKVQGSINLTQVDFPPSLDTNPFAVNIHLSNVGQIPLEDVFFWIKAIFQPIDNMDSNAADRKEYFELLKEGKSALKDSRKNGHAPLYFAVGQDHWGTMMLHPRSEEITGVLNGTMRLYFFAYAEWDDGKSKYIGCRWLQPPPSVSYGSGANLVLHDCTW